MTVSAVRISILAALIAMASSGAAPAAVQYPGLPKPVTGELGDGEKPVQRKWGLPANLAGVEVNLGRLGVKTGLRRMEPYAMPAVTSGGCAGPPTVNGGPEKGEDPSRKFLFDGLDAFKKGQTDEAAFNFERGRTALPGSPYADESLFWLGETRRTQGKNSEAIIAFEKVKGAMRGEALYRLAWLLERESREERVKSAWAEVASDAGNPHRGEAYYRLSLLSLKAGRADRAKEDLERALDLSKNDSDVYASAAYLLGVMHRDEGRHAAARKILETMLLARPDHPSAPAARVLLGFVEAESGNPKGALARLEEFLAAARPGDPMADRARYGLAMLAAAQGDAAGVGKIVKSFSPSGEEPWASRALADLGMRLYRTGNHSGALQAFREAIVAGKGRKNCSERHMEGLTLIALNRPGEAAKAFDSIETECPAAPDGWHAGALALSEAGDDRGAFELLRKIVALRPDYEAMGMVRVEMGRINARGGKTEAAARAFEAVGEESPGLADALFGRARIAFEAGRMEEASGLLESFTRRFPDHSSATGALIMLAKAQAARGSTEAALAALDKVAARAAGREDREEAKFERGWILLNSGREEEGARELETMLKGGDGGRFRADAEYSVGLYRYARGAFADALAHFEAALKSAVRPDLKRLAGLGAADSLFGLGRHAEALKAYKETGRDREALAGMILSLGMMGRVDEMLAELDVYGKTFPGDGQAAELAMAAGDALARTGRAGEAAAKYELAASVSAGGLKAEALLKSGRALAGTGRLKDAEERFRAAGGAAGMREAAAMWEKEGRREKALAAWDEIARGPYPSEARLHALKKAAEAEAGLGRPREAESRLEAALSLAGDDLQTRQAILVELGRAALGEGALEKAMERLRKAVAMGEGENGLAAMILLAEALMKSGAAQASLETYLRIGYHYPVSLEPAAKAAMTAAERLKTAGRNAEAEALLRKVAEGGPSPLREEAAAMLPADAGATKVPEQKPPE